VNAPEWPHGTRRVVRRWAWLTCLALAGCHRDKPQDPAPQPVAPASTVASPPTLPVEGRGGSPALAPDPALKLSGDGVFLCTKKDQDAVVQRVALPNGDAYVVSHGAQGWWATSDGEHFEPPALKGLELAFRQHGFFAFPPQAHVDAGSSREWELRFASPGERHQAISYEQPSLVFRQLFDACEQAFSALSTTRTDVETALVLYRTLEEYAQSLPRTDLRRQMLLEWLDSLQADFASP
jgi:hypothetical protein